MIGKSRSPFYLFFFDIQFGNAAVSEYNAYHTLTHFIPFIAKRLGLKFKNISAEQLYDLVKAKKVSYEQIKDMDPQRFKDLEYTMKLIFNHDDDTI